MAETTRAPIVQGRWKDKVIQEKIVLLQGELEHAKQAPLPKSPGVMAVTPDIAMGWLARDNRNRPLRMRRVSDYISEISDSRWKRNGQTISFKEDGSLNDGQHRLWAIVLAQKTIEADVSINVPNDAFGTVDTGLSRKASDVLFLADVKYHSWLGGAVRMALLYQRTPRKHYNDGWEHAVKVHNDEILDYVQEHPELVKIAAEVSKMRLHEMMTPATAIFAWAEMRDMDRRRADQFMAAVASGEELKRGHPALTLRNELLNREGKRLKPVEVLARIIKAWNAFYYNKSFGGYRFQKDGMYPNFGDQDELRDMPEPPKAGLVKRQRVVEERLA